MMKQFVISLFRTLIFLGGVPSLCAAATSVPNPVVRFDSRIYPANLSQNSKLTIAHSEFDPSQGSGEIVSNVNIFNGMPYYQVPLMGLNARNTLSWNFSLVYNGSSVEPQLKTAKIRSSSGPLGLGWSMVTPYISVNHMGTVSTTDDILYCNLGPYGGGQILQNESGEFFVSTNPYINVKPIYDINPLVIVPRIVSWEFTMPDGNKMFFGETSNSRRTVRSFGNVVGAHPAAAYGEDLIYQYDLSRFSDFFETTNIMFDYSQVLEPVTNSASYVRESALSSVYWKSNGVTMDSVALVYINKMDFEYPGYETDEAKDGQRIYETRCLSQLELYVRGTRKEKFEFEYTFETLLYDANSSNRAVCKINRSVVGGESWSWLFEYNQNNLLLKKIVLPDKSVETYEYDDVDMSLYDDAQASKNVDVLKDELGNDLVLLDSDMDKYENSASCTEKFCFVQLTMPSNKKKNLYVQVYQNNGNYFKESRTFSIMNAEKPIARFSSNYFILADIGGTALKFYEWDGFEFQERSPEIGGVFNSSALFAGQLENVYVEDNYALILEKNGNDHYIHTIVKNQASGKWELTSKKNDVKCQPNTGDYGDKIRDVDSEYCLEWNDDILVQTSPSLFVVMKIKKNVLNVFGFNGNSFDDLSRDKHVIMDMGVQKNSDPNCKYFGTGCNHYNANYYGMNFDLNIANMTLSGNTLILSFRESGFDFVYAFDFDGINLLPLFQDYFKVIDDNGAGYFYVQDDYILGVFPSISNVIYWRKILSDNPANPTDPSKVITYKRVTDNVFPFDGENNSVYASCSFDAFYLEELDKDMNPVVKGNAYHHVLNAVVDKSPFTLVDYTKELSADDCSLAFVQSDPVVYLEKKTCSGSLCRNGAKPDGIVPNSRGRRYYNSRANGVAIFNSNNFIENNLGFTNSGATWDDGKWTVSNASRLMISSVLDKTSKRNLIAFGQYSGENFTTPKSVPVVKSFKKFNGLESFGVASLYAEFDYGNPVKPVSPDRAEFNVHTQQPQFKNISVKNMSTGNTTPLSATKYNFIVDLKDSSLEGTAINMQGSVRSQENYDASSALRNSVRYVYNVECAENVPYVNWPNGLCLNLLDSTNTKTTDYYGNAMSSTTKNVLLDFHSGQYDGMVSRNGDKYAFSQKILNKQTIMDSKGISYTFTNPEWLFNYVPFDEDPYEYPSNSSESIKVIESYIRSNNAGSINGFTLFRDSLSNGVQMEYSVDRPHLPIKKYSWRPTINFNSNGIFYNPYQGYVLDNSVVSVNNYGQVTESMSRDVNGMRSSCTIYEGLRSLPTISFAGAACSDVAGTTAEEGDLNGWEMAQTKLSSAQVYDGLYSFSVTDGYGPTHNISLKEVNKFKYDYVISGYAYSTGAPPMLMAEFRRADLSIAKVLASYTPVSGKFEANKWQRYELEIPYDELVADGMFRDPSVDDHLRIWLGFGAPKNDNSRIMYVDNIVAYPTSSTFSLKNYDDMGLPISSMDANFERQEIVYDKNHRARAIRDSKGRIFNDNAKHLMNENVR